MSNTYEKKLEMLAKSIIRLPNEEQENIFDFLDIRTKNKIKSIIK